MEDKTPYIKHNEKTVFLQDEGLRKLKGFVQIPKVVLLSKKISYGAKVAYGILLGYAWQDDFCFPAQKSLADDLGCSVRQAQRFLEELKEGKFIAWKQMGLNRPNIYSLLSLPATEESEKRSKIKDTTNLSYPDTTEMSLPDATNLSRQDTTPMSYKEYSVNYNNVNVNGTSKKTEKTDLRKLPDIEQDREKTKYVADEIFAQLGDKQSKAFYYLVAAKVPEREIRQALAEIKQSEARSPAAVFTSRMKTYAAEATNRQHISSLYSSADLAEKMQLNR